MTATGTGSMLDLDALEKNATYELGCYPEDWVVTGPVLVLRLLSLARAGRRLAEAAHEAIGPHSLHVDALAWARWNEALVAWREADRDEP